MPKHEDDELVKLGYASSRNISFHGKDELDVTWGDWREMNDAAKDEVVQEYANSLVDVWVEEDEN